MRRLLHSALHHDNDRDQHAPVPTPATGRPPPAGALGANYNESLVWIRHDELRRLGALWVRGFVEMHRVNPRHGPNLKALLGAGAAGFKTILSLKWNYTNRDFPAPGSPAMAEELQRLNELLPFVWGRVDMLVVGNEPFIEAKADQRGRRLNEFYETMAEAVVSFRNAHGPSTRLYMGALNRLDLPARRTPAVERMLRYIASKPEMDGVDLHLHLPDRDGHRAMLDYALSRIRPDQTFLATEFSMVWHWKKHMGDDASPAFCQRYGYAPGTKVYQVIDGAISNPMPASQWFDFLSNEPWYTRHRNFISETVKVYRATGRLDVATYSFCAMRERKHPFLPTDTPWMLNGLIPPSTVQAGPDGSRGDNFPWADDFRLAQQVGR